MKSKIKVERILGISLLVSTFLLAWQAYAQKPKGKPWNAPEAAAKVKNPNTVNAEFIAAGKALYSKHCKSCHGSGGKGDGPKANGLEISSGDFTSEEFKAESEGTIYWKTTEGRDPMPTFKKKMTDEERWQVVAYMQTLGKK